MSQRRVQLMTPAHETTLREAGIHSVGQASPKPCSLLFPGLVIAPQARYHPVGPQGDCVFPELFFQYHWRRKREEAGSAQVYLRPRTGSNFPFFSGMFADAGKEGRWEGGTLADRALLFQPHS